jgi:2-isopropylmalate synthase
MALRTRPQYYAVTTGVDSTQIVRSSSMVSTHTGISVQPNKAIVGANAFAHEAGIHQHGVLRNALTYEIMTPESVGLSKNALVLGKHSGRHAFKDYLTGLGYDLDRESLDKVFTRFKLLADKKKLVTDADLEAIIHDELFQPPEVYRLENVQVICGIECVPTATVRLRTPEGEVASDAALGDGPVDAVYQAINRVIGVDNELVEFSISAITEGMDAVGEVTIRIAADISANGEPVKRVFSGRGIDTDIVVASAKAYMFALNKLLAAKREMVRQKQWQAGGNFGPEPTRATYTLDGLGSKDLFKP